VRAIVPVAVLAVVALAVALAGCGDGGGDGGAQAKRAAASTTNAAPRREAEPQPRAEPKPSAAPKHKAEPKREAEPKLLVGAVEDAAKYARDPVAQMQLARDSGFHAIVLSAVWEDGARASADLPRLRRAVDAAVRERIRPVLAIYQFSSSTPADAGRRDAFVTYAAALAKGLPGVRDVIVGNEPNLNLFWQPQFDGVGRDVAAEDYESLLAAAYDRLKAQDASLNVIGGGLAPRGGDRPSSRPTHSPTRFIEDLGAAYRATGRTEPIMDALSIHVYGDSQKVPPSFRHPLSTTIGIADYAKLVALLRAAFAGTAQRGATLPIVYGEYGVETRIPPAKAYFYTGREPTAPVDEATQARFYVQAIHAAKRQPNVRMLFIFHVVDETRLEGLQSGTRYADGSAKASEAPVRAALEAASTPPAPGRDGG
jgi:hypothetical protein